MRCDSVAGVLAGVVDGSAQLDRSDQRHVEHCLRCQAELARHRRLLRVARSLRTDVWTPPPGLLGEVLAHLEAAGDRAAVRGALSGRRVVYVGGIAAATAAGAGAAVVLVVRGRRARLPLAG